MLKINNVSYSYSLKGHKVLDDFSLSLSSGGVYGLLGPNGAGKSTLLNIIAGTLTLSHGNVTLDGTDTRRRLPVTLTDIFFVPEEFSLPPMKLSKYARLYGAMYPRFSEDDMKRYLEMFELPSDVRLDALSMGQKKKVFMSFAMACNTRVLLMDEPTNGLDIPGKSAFRRFTASNIDDERIFVISTHQVRDVDRLLDHILIMNHSHVLLDERVYEIQKRLKFIETNNAQLITEALHSIPSIGGASIIIPNDDQCETDINLELLFDFIQRKPDLAKTIFNAPEK
ncbi:MAG: ABC transporter ATP-binding protein [Muribaculaceae bacterium]